MPRVSKKILNEEDVNDFLAKVLDVANNEVKRLSKKTVLESEDIQALKNLATIGTSIGGYLKKKSFDDSAPESVEDLAEDI